METPFIHPRFGRIFPTLDPNILPDEEREEGCDLMLYGAEIWAATVRFSNAVDLFGYCDRELPRRNDWKQIAARDGAWSIHNFGATMKWFRSGLRNLPNMRRLINSDVLRSASRRWSRSFPHFPDMRHALAHFPESTSTPEGRRENVFVGPFRSDGMIIEGDQTKVSIKSSLNGRKFQTTFRGRLLTYEISDLSLAELIAIKDEFISGLDAITHWRG